MLRKRLIARVTLLVLCWLPVDFVLAQQANQQYAPLLLRLPLPLDQHLSAATMAWTNATGVPVGVECYRQAGQSTTPSKSRVVSTLELSGLTVDESVQEISRHLPPEYRSSFDGTMLIVRQTELGPLDRVVPEFSLTGSGLLPAAEAVRKIFEPDYATKAVPIPMPAGEESAFESLARQRHNERFRPAVSVQLVNVTVEQLLTAISKSYGGASWKVQYISPKRRFEEAVLTFYKPRGVSVSLGPLARPGGN